MQDKRYIGNRLVLSVVPSGKDKVRIQFKKREEIELAKNVYELIVTDDVQGGQIYEILQDKLARKLLKIMAVYGIPVHQTESVIGRVGTLVHNLTQEATAKKFNVDSYSDLLLLHIL